MLLDKTGTLTEGRLEVTRILCAPGVDANEVLAAAAATLGAAPHPIAAGVRREAERRGTRFGALEQRVLPGLGVEAGALLCGSRALLEARGVALDPALAAAAQEAASEGASLAFVAESGRALGALALSDTIRGDARAALARLAAKGVTVALVSGDHAAAARRAAEQAGIAEVVSDASPEEKVARVRGERARGARVAFAGDGLNDAAALAAAELGFAFAQGSDVTLHAADVVSHAPGLLSLPRALELGRAAMRRIHENLALAIPTTRWRFRSRSPESSVRSGPRSR